MKLFDLVVFVGTYRFRHRMYQHYYITVCLTQCPGVANVILVASQAFFPEAKPSHLSVWPMLVYN